MGRNRGRDAWLPLVLEKSILAGWSMPNLSACICKGDAFHEYHAQLLLRRAVLSLMSLICIQGRNPSGWTWGK